MLLIIVEQYQFYQYNYGYQILEQLFVLQLNNYKCVASIMNNVI